MSRAYPVGATALTVLLIACQAAGLAAPVSIATPAWTAASTPSPTPSPPPTVTPILFPTYTPTSPPTETIPPTPTHAPTLTPEPAWAVQGPGQVIVPILLYHHIGSSQVEGSEYYISPAAFDRQMSLLYQWGYRSVSVELIARAIREGAALPPRPVLITFDDGSASTHETALPIMQRYGFTGVAYIVSNYVGVTHYMNADQIRALHAAGWEIGSHSLSHLDLTTRPDRQEDEIVQSRRHLESLLGAPVRSFAYPFGAYDTSSLGYVHFAGYTAAMGLGDDSAQGTENLYYLYRQAVRGTDDLQAFAQKLPWRAEGIDLPPVTIIP